jgi:hypothetical protein
VATTRRRSISIAPGKVLKEKEVSREITIFRGECFLQCGEKNTEPLTQVF